MYSRRIGCVSQVRLLINIQSRLEKEIMECNQKISEMQTAVDESQKIVQERDSQVDALQKQLNTLRFAYIK